jgi:Tol biopolymer transport system component
VVESERRPLTGHNPIGARDGYPDRVRVLRMVGLVAAMIAAGAVGWSRAAAPDAGVLVVRIADGTRERLTGLEGSPRFSRDGRRVFVSGDTVKTHAYTFAVFTGGRRIDERAIRSPEVLGGAVAVSPQERRIAFVQGARSSRLVTGDLTVARVDAGRAHPLLARAVGTPAWSPDGSRIAVERYSRREATGLVGKPDDPSRIAIVRSDGSGVVRSAGRGAAPAWLPDGRLLVLVETRRSADLVVTRAGGARRTVLRDVRGGEWQVSPDGRHVAVAAAGQGSPHYHVTVVDLATGTPTRLSDETADDIAWSPDGTRLAATVGYRLLLLDPSGQSAPQTLIRIPKRDLSRPAWSPDGGRIAVSAAVVRPYRD